MNTPSPLIPQGSLERQSKGKSTVRIAIFTIVSIHAVFFAGLLMQGCRRDDTKASTKAIDTATNQNTLPSLEAGYYPATQDIAQTASTVPTTGTTPPTGLSEASPTLPPPASTSDTASETKSYTVAPKDTLAKIAKANGVTIGALTKANPSLEPSKLRPGQKIQIPMGAAPAAAGIGFKEPGTSDSAAGGSRLYTVKAGETLTRIAKQHGLSVKALRAANNLKSDRLLVGSKLKLPMPQSGAPAQHSKTSSVGKLTATNPAHITPISTTTPAQ